VAAELSWTAGDDDELLSGRARPDDAVRPALHSNRRRAAAAAAECRLLLGIYDMKFTTGTTVVTVVYALHFGLLAYSAV